MIAAIYARKSTEQNGVAQDAKSVTRQVEHAHAYKARLVNLAPFLFYPSLHVHICTNLTRQNVRPTLARCSKPSN